MVAASGEKLARVVSPPTQTRTQIRLSKDLGAPVFVVSFQPYGLARNGTAVIRVTKASAEGGTRLAASFAQALAGQNLQVSVATDSKAILDSGGTYTGRVTLVGDSGVDSFAISAVKRVN